LSELSRLPRSLHDIEYACASVGTLAAHPTLGNRAAKSDKILTDSK
jgi:hypothetical protein